MGSIVRRVVAGAVAGVVGTAAMDAVWYGRYRDSGGQAGPVEWDMATGSVESFDEASAPGQVGERMAEAFGAELSDELAGTTTDVMHWMTGTAYGVVHALLQDHRGPLLGGAMTGVGAFLNSYATLGAAGIYKSIWDYEPEELEKDLTAHLAYGLATGFAYRLLRGRS